MPIIVNIRALNCVARRVGRMVGWGLLNSRAYNGFGRAIVGKFRDFPRKLKGTEEEKREIDYF